MGQLLAAGEPFVYAYYDGVDKVAHGHGFGPHYDAELVAADRLVADLIETLPAGAALVVTADHGQVSVGDAYVPVDAAVAAETTMMSGEGRFRWLHVAPERVDAVAAAARRRYQDEAWVWTVDELVDQGFFGGMLTPSVKARLGDVALVPFLPVALPRPGRPGRRPAGVPPRFPDRSRDARPAAGHDRQQESGVARGIAVFSEPPPGRMEFMATTDEPVSGVIVEPEAEGSGESIDQPGKVMRIGSMIKQLLEEVRQAPLDEASRERLRDIYDTSIQELASGLSEDLQAELARITIPFGDTGATPSDAQLRVAQAQLVGWLEGLFHGIQATLFAQQMAARNQLEEMRRRSLPAGSDDRQPPMGGTYL